MVTAGALALETVGTYEGEPLLEPVAAAITPVEPLDSQIPDRLRVGFYNVEMFTDGIKDGKNRTEASATNQAAGAATISAELKADLLFISEIENGRVLGYLNDNLPEPYPYGYIAQFGTESGRIEKMNIALLSRLTPEEVFEVDFGPLRGRYRPTRGVLGAVFDLGDGHALLAYGTHLKANWGDRQRNYAQRVNAMRLIRADAERRLAAAPDRNWEVVLLGDFNTDPLMESFADDPTLKVLADWDDLWSGHLDISDLYTVPTRRGDPMREFPPALFDRILVHPGMRESPWVTSLPGVIMKGTVTEDVTVLPGQGAHVSDHFPIYIDLRR
jgi:endonuclease/exonuclease/phosphatase family metal-dependent hydrolase